MQKPEPTPVYDFQAVCYFLADFLNEKGEEWRQDPNVGAKDGCEVERQLIGNDPDRSGNSVWRFDKDDIGPEGWPEKATKCRLLLHELFGDDILINIDW